MSAESDFAEALETLTEKQVEEFVGSAMQRRHGRYSHMPPHAFSYSTM